MVEGMIVVQVAHDKKTLDFGETATVIHLRVIRGASAEQ
jgi:hypothetical protein